MNASTPLESRALESAGLLAVVADPVRWRLLAHLADLVRVRRRGRWMDYPLAADALGRLRAALPGVLSTPALVIDEQVVLSGRVPIQHRHLGRTSRPPPPP